MHDVVLYRIQESDLVRFLRTYRPLKLHTVSYKHVWTDADAKQFVAALGPILERLGSDASPQLLELVRQVVERPTAMNAVAWRNAVNRFLGSAADEYAGRCGYGIITLKVSSEIEQFFEAWNWLIGGGGPWPRPMDSGAPFSSPQPTEGIGWKLTSQASSKSWLDFEDESVVAVAPIVVPKAGRTFIGKRLESIRRFVASPPAPPSLEAILAYKSHLPYYRPFGEPSQRERNFAETKRLFAEITAFVVGLADAGEGFLTRSIDTQEYE